MLGKHFLILERKVGFVINGEARSAPAELLSGLWASPDAGETVGDSGFSAQASAAKLFLQTAVSHGQWDAHSIQT